MSDSHTFPQTSSFIEYEGGGLSYSLFPPTLAMIAGVLLLIIFGKTTGPQDENKSINEHPIVSATARLSPIFTQEVLYWETSIFQWAEEWSLDANFVATVMQIESCGDPTAVSRSGAMGLVQVMPYHFEEGENRFLPETNADM